MFTFYRSDRAELRIGINGKYSGFYEENDINENGTFKTKMKENWKFSVNLFCLKNVQL